MVWVDEVTDEVFDGFGISDNFFVSVVGGLSRKFESVEGSVGGEDFAFVVGVAAIFAFEIRVELLTDAAQKNTIHGSKAVGEPPLMLAISVREALRNTLGENGKDLPSPVSPEIFLRKSHC